MLNYRPSRARGAEIIDELPVEVLRILVRESKAMTFKALPEEDEAEGEDDLLAQPGDKEGDGGPAARHVDLQLQTNLASARLQTRLIKTYRDARTFTEEQGVGILYLAFGMLQWYEDGSSETIRKAPLLLVPVELERSSAQEKFRLLYTDEELGDNLPLKHKLKLEFGIEMPDMLPQEDLDLTRYFGEVARAVSERPRWSVDQDAMVLGFFSFSKLLMYRDLDGENWPEGDGPADHPIIRMLFDEEAREETEQLSEDEYLDEHLDPAEVHQVVDADSSQTLAMLDVSEGRNLVVQGPPGTGKSQTITNIIADAVGHGKTVLFVAEKMAALEVVKRRLDSVGLGEACLELHSRKANKKAVLQELDRTMRLGQPKVREIEDDLNVLIDARERLNKYSEAINASVGESGVTPYRAIGELVRLGTDAASLPRMGFDGMRGWTAADFRQRRELVGELQAKLASMGAPSQNPFFGSTRTVLVPTEQARIREALSAAGRSTRDLRKTATDLASALKLSPPETRKDAGVLCRAARRATDAPRLEGVRLQSGEWQSRRDDLRSLITAGEAHSGLRGQYDEVLIPEAWDQDLLEMRQHLANYGDRWWRSISGDYRQARNRLRGLCKEDLPKDVSEQLALVDAVLEACRHREVIQWFEPLGSRLFGAQWQGERSDWQVLNRLVEWVIELYRQVGEGDLPEGLIDFLAGDPAIEGIGRKISDVEDALLAQNAAMETALEDLQISGDARTALEELTLIDQEKTLGSWERNLDKLQELVTYNQLAEPCRENGLETVLQRTESWSEAGSRLVDAFRYTWFEGLLEGAFRDRPALARFDRDNHEYVAEKFRELDRLVIEHNRARLAHKHWQRVPTSTQAGGQLGVLRREIQKKRRHLPLRQLTNRAGNAVQALKPVFMMSPLSIANFLEPGSVEFDLVVFDEASQVRPVEALGAIARGRQVVVVGDSKQLPPTSFFDRLIHAEETEEENLTADLESVLGLFSAQGVPERMLRWHYRSRHESLITVSNNEFYENRLVVFPSPDRGQEDTGLVYHYLPETSYDRGGSRSNLGEAKAVAGAVMRHAQERPHLSLGVAAFSAAQAQAIEDQIEGLRRAAPECEGFFTSHPFEPFFVKNLENVQGDERDAIFISVGYGRTTTGQIPMSFGPINQDGGERRLNVLITRARRSCEVFTNMTSDDIDLRRTSARGVQAFKTFLHYAERGELDLPEPTGREPDSPFEEAVLRALIDAGYRVETQVGSAGFFIDLAVVDPEKPGRYLLGIECDGATYHSARSARDRDRLRQEVLENLGWRIHRIWSTDWFRYPGKELGRVVEAIEEARLYAGSSENRQQDIPASKVALTSEDTAITRDEKAAPTEPNSVPGYEKFDIRISVSGGELHEADPDSLADFIASIVEVESPVHVQEVSRRITEAAFVMRTGSRIRAVIEESIKRAVGNKKVIRRGDFLWQPGMTESPLRDRSELPDASRKVDFVAPEEVGVAVERAVGNSYGISRNNAGPAALRLLGFSRTSRAASNKVKQAIEMLLAEGKVVEKDNELTLGKP